MSWFVENNRRSAPRRLYNNGAWIRLGGTLIQECQVIDLSRTGVRLTVKNAGSIPETFILILSKGSVGQPARVKWRRGTQVGAEFMTNSSFAACLADIPKSNSSSASRLAASAPKADSPSAPRLAADGARAVKSTQGEGRKSERPMSTLLAQAHDQKRQDPAGFKALAPNSFGSAGSDKVKVEVHCPISTLSEQRDLVDHEKIRKTRMDLSRLQKKLGPDYIALIHALKDIDPESPRGQELASIIDGLDDTSG